MTTFPNEITLTITQEDIDRGAEAYQREHMLSSTCAGVQCFDRQFGEELDTHSDGEYIFIYLGQNGRVQYAPMDRSFSDFTLQFDRAVKTGNKFPSPGTFKFYKKEEYRATN